MNNQVPVFDIVAESGLPYSLLFTYKDGAGVPIDVTGYTGTVKVKGSGAQSRVYVTQALTFGGVNGKVSAVIQTTDFDFTDGAYVVDMTPPAGTPFRALKGAFTIDRDWK